MNIVGVRALETQPDSDRGARRNFSPSDSRVTVVLDYVSGKGWILVHATTYVLNIARARDIRLTRSAYHPKFDYATRDPNWLWEDSPRNGRRRLRVHVTAKPPTGGVLDQIQAAAAPSPDFQIVFDRNPSRGFGAVEYQGDSFPNVAVFRYKGCDGAYEKMIDERHPRNAFAWIRMITFNGNWKYDRKYPRVR